MVMLGLTIFIFLSNPIDQMYHKIFPVRDDMGVMGGLIITAFIVIEACLIRLDHYWKWIISSTFIFEAAASISYGFPEFYAFSSKLSEVLINGGLFLIFTIPVAFVVYYMKKIIKYSLKWKEIKAMPYKIILISILWELFLIWFIFGV